MPQPRLSGRSLWKTSQFTDKKSMRRSGPLDITRKQVFKQTEFQNLIPWPLTSKSRGSSKGHIRCKQLCKISLQKPKDFTQYCGKVKVLQTDRTIDERTDRLKLIFSNFSGGQQTSKLSQLCFLSEVSVVWLNKSVRYLASGSKWFVVKTKVKAVKTEKLKICNKPMFVL